MMKKITKFSTMLLPLSLTFALSFLLGASYAFSLVLYFLILLPLILFNVMEFHKWVFDHKVFICIFDNLWLISTIFWLINIWTINKYYQPYYLFQISPKAWLISITFYFASYLSLYTSNIAYQYQAQAITKRLIIFNML